MSNFENKLYTALYQILATANPNIGTANVELVNDRINRLTEILIEMIDTLTTEKLLAILEPYNTKINEGFAAVEKEIGSVGNGEC